MTEEQNELCKDWDEIFENIDDDSADLYAPDGSYKEDDWRD